MSATVIYGVDFKEDVFEGAKGPYSELNPIDGGDFGLSYSSLDDIKTYCKQFGIPVESWPDYIGADGIDIPVEELKRKNENLRTVLTQLTSEQRQGIRWLDRFCQIMDEGKLFYIL